jgi:hypothetical protein
MTVPNGAGEFVIGGLPSGEYFVAAAARIEEDEWQHPAVLDALRRRATRVSILERQQATVAIEAVAVTAPR